MPSPYLQRNFKPKNFYHIFNRGVFKQKLFRNKQDYQTFIDILKYYLRYPSLGAFAKLSDRKLQKLKNKSTSKPYVLHAYCLMPNHFHLLLFQNKSSPTLTNLIRKVSVAYAMYFQYKYKHSGALFQGTYKCVKIFEDEQLLYLTKYIHLNPQKSEGSVPSKFPYSSLKDYLQLNNKPKDWLDPKTIMKKFFPKSLNCPKDYLAFIKDQNNSKLKQLLKQKTLD